MKKILSLVALVVLSTAVAFGQSGKSAKEIRQQNFIFGPKVGLSMPYQHLVTNTTALQSLLGGPNAGIQLGGYMRGIIPLKGGFSLYGQLDASWDMDFYFGGGQNASAGYFTFPLVVGGGYKLNDQLNLRLGGGVTFSANIYQTANTTFKGEDNDYQTAVAEMLNRNPWGWTAAIGLDWQDWTADLRYMNQFRSGEVGRIADEYRYISIGLTLGYRF
jgi:hypothetical protein